MAKNKKNKETPFDFYILFQFDRWGEIEIPQIIFKTREEAEYYAKNHFSKDESYTIKGGYFGKIL